MMLNSIINNKTVPVVLVLVNALIIINCSPVTGEIPPLSPATLVYMAADNNLDYYGIANIKQMERGFPDNAEGFMYVFIDRVVGANPSHP